MNFKLSKSSDWDSIGDVEINTLEELLEFTRKSEHDVIIGTYGGEEWYLEIYDDYREWLIIFSFY